MSIGFLARQRIDEWPAFAEITQEKAVPQFPLKNAFATGKASMAKERNNRQHQAAAKATARHLRTQDF
jgi:hypothetical protein